MRGVDKRTKNFLFLISACRILSGSIFYVTSWLIELRN